MEDQNNPNAESIPSLTMRRLDSFKSSLSHLTNNTSSPLNLSIENLNKNTPILKVQGVTTELDSSNTDCILNWLNPIPKDYSELERINLSSLEKSRKNYNQFRKKLLGHLKKFRKIKNNQNKELQKFFEDDQIRELYNIIHNHQSLPNFLLNLPIFKSYSVCQIIAHEKGQGFVTSTFTQKGSKTLITKYEVQGFNKVFQTVKKAKSRIFSSDIFDNKIIESIGVNLAVPFNSGRYNVLLFLGRNDFLPPTDEEQKSFLEVAKNLEPILNAILIRSSKDDKISNIIETLENIDFPTTITDRRNNFLFKNESFESISESDLKDYHKIEKELYGKNSLNFFFTKEDQEDTDLYHFYRVSLLGELLNTLRHELSNPLFGLSLAADILNHDDLEDDITETLEDIKTNSERCQTIIKNFSNLYQEEENFKLFNIDEIIKETIILTKSETKGIRKIITKNGTKTELFSNPTWLSQIVFNLIINSGQALAEHYPGTKLREAEIHLEMNDTDDGITIQISDNGPGIPEDLLPKMFDAFFTTKDAGTGLGLAICKNLIKKLEGELSFKNKIGKGATFTLYIPNLSI